MLETLYNFLKLYLYLQILGLRMPYFIDSPPPEKDTSPSTSPSPRSSPRSFKIKEEKKMLHVPFEITDRVSLLVRAIEFKDDSTVKSLLTLYEELDPNAQLPGILFFLPMIN